MTLSFNQYSENETKIWRQNILNQFNRVSSSCLRSHFVISLINPEVGERAIKHFIPIGQSSAHETKFVIVLCESA